MAQLTRQWARSEVDFAMASRATPTGDAEIASIADSVMASMPADKAKSKDERPSLLKRCRSQARKAARSMPLRMLKNRSKELHHTSQQSSSLIFRLPAELRAEIWAYTFCESREAHFDIFDRIYDSCTYKVPSLTRQYCRRNPVRTSLLLTCRAAYVEAVQYLYDNTRFTLAVCAGRRETEIVKDHHCLGRLQERTGKSSNVLKSGPNFC